MKKSLKITAVIVAMLCMFTVIFSGCGSTESKEAVTEDNNSAIAEYTVNTSADELTVKVGEVGFIAYSVVYSPDGELEGPEVSDTDNGDVATWLSPIEFYLCMPSEDATTSGEDADKGMIGNYSVQSSVWTLEAPVLEDYEGDEEAYNEDLAAYNAYIHSIPEGVTLKEDITIDDVDEDTLNFAKNTVLTSVDDFVCIYAIQGCSVGTSTITIGEKTVTVNIVE